MITLICLAIWSLRYAKRLTQPDSLTTAAGVVWLLATWISLGAQPLAAASPRYSDPGWAYVFDGDEAFYNDPDGPNPDYILGDATNSPGGLGGTAALEFPGWTDPSCNPALTRCEVDNSRATWIHAGSQWDGSAPGAPLGRTPSFGQSPPSAPAAPGGVATLQHAGVSFLRIQDAGQPQSWGWADKGNQANLDSAKQEGSNRRIQFAHPIARDAAFSGNSAVLDEGITISFRTRLATRATGPLDDVYPEDLEAPIPWPEQGKGYPVANNGRGMFMITQTGANGGGQFALSILDQETINVEGLTTTRTGLVMNNKFGSPDTDDATSASLNVVDIPNEKLTDWQEVWLTIRKATTPDAPGTHEVKVYLNGSLEAQEFSVTLGNQNEFGSGPHLGLGLSSGTRWGAYDVDYFAYKEGVVEPQLPIALAGDYNSDQVVDAADFTVWRERLGTALPLPNEMATPGTVTIEDYEVWRTNFGSSLSSPRSLRVVPEPGAVALLFPIALWVVICRRCGIGRFRHPSDVPC